MKKITKPIALILALVTLAAPLSASAQYKDSEITVSYRNVKLRIDDQPFTPTDKAGNYVEPFILDGTTYLPVRAVAEALGRPVDFDSATNTVKIGAQHDSYLPTNPEQAGRNTDERITVFYRDVKLEIGGVPFTPTDLGGNVVEPFIYNNTTYLPLRAVAAAAGTEVVWDGLKNTVRIGIQPVTNVYSKSSPAPIGAQQTVLCLSPSGIRYTARVMVREAFSGTAATKLIFGASQLNPPPAFGKRYGLARVTVSIDRASSAAPFNLSAADFDFFGSTDKIYADCGVVIPYPAFGDKVAAGSTISGYVPYLVDNSEQRVKLAFGADAAGNGGIWFSVI